MTYTGDFSGKEFRARVASGNRRPMGQIAIDEQDLGYACALEIAGTTCTVRSNSPKLASTLRFWRGETERHDPDGFSMGVVVCETGDQYPTLPHFRGLGHIVIATFGGSNVFIFDLLRREISATVSPQLAATPEFWNDTLFPIAIGVLGPAIGVVPVHAACLVAAGKGLLVAGASGAGKSTLAVALAQAGLDYVSDDWTYIGHDRRGLSAHGVGAPAKLLPDAIRHFPSLARFELSVALNGELAYLLSASEAFAANSALSCVPRWFVFLERTSRSGCEITPIPAEQTHRYVESSVEPLPKELSAAEHNRTEIISRIALLPSWRLRYGGTPQFAAQELSNFFSSHMEEVQS